MSGHIFTPREKQLDIYNAYLSVRVDNNVQRSLYYVASTKVSILLKH